MTSVNLYKQDGSQNGTVELNDAVFGVEPNENVVFDAILRQRASLRQGTHAVKNRSAVSGGGKKPWRGIFTPLFNVTKFSMLFSSER